jgi:hypothetical protein
MKLTLPLVVRAESLWQKSKGLKRASGVCALGIKESVDQGGRAVLKGKCWYVAVWQPGASQHATAKGTMGAPRLVMYSPYSPKVRARRDGKIVGWPYQAPRPALLCDSPEAAKAVYDLFGGYKKCAHCGEPFLLIRKDQTSCGKPSCRVYVCRARNSVKRKRRAR